MSKASLMDAVRPHALKARDAAGRATTGRRALPSLLICGGQRCGTTSMYKALVQQPQIFRPVWRKGVHFFDMDYDRGEAWYRSHFPLASTLDRAAARHHTSSLTFESSPYYLFHPLAADRIATTLPGVRIVVLVRDPIERAYSAHAHELARGFETLPFEEALRVEDERLAGEEERLRADPTYASHAHRHQAYRSRGEYAPQLARLADTLGRDNLKVIDSHRFFSEPEAVFGDLLTWLGTKLIVPGVYERHNARPRLELDPAVRADLDRHFEPFDTDLTPWLGQVPSWRE